MRFNLHLNSCGVKSIGKAALGANTRKLFPRGVYVALQVGLAQMLKGGVIMDVTTPEEARIAGGIWSLLLNLCCGLEGTSGSQVVNVR